MAGMKGKSAVAAVVAAVVLIFAITVIIGGGMTELRHEIHINASPEKVWSILANLEAVQHYNPTVAEAHYISSNQAGVGAARQCRLKDDSVIKERVLEWEPGNALTIELYESAWPVTNMKWRTELLSSGGGTVVRQVMEYRPRGIAGAILNVFVMKRNINKTVTAVFQELKRYVENRDV